MFASFNIIERRDLNLNFVFEITRKFALPFICEMAFDKIIHRYGICVLGSISFTHRVWGTAVIA